VQVSWDGMWEGGHDALEWSWLSVVVAMEAVKGNSKCEEAGEMLEGGGGEEEEWESTNLDRYWIGTGVWERFGLAQESGSTREVRN
jgi:hypothetical protein